MNQRYGASHPEVVDLVTESAGICYLYLLEEDELDGDVLLGVQQKLNNYLNFMLDGQFHSMYPSYKNSEKVVRLNLRHAPSEFAEEFLRRVKSIFAEHDVGFEVEIESTSHDA
jgi:hypothetical protein